MKEILEKRLQELHDELKSGQSMLGELDRKRAGLRTLLLRIDGAIEVVDELLKEQAITDPATKPVVATKVA